MQARPQVGLFFGVSTLARKWLAKINDKNGRFGQNGQNGKMTQKAWFSIIGDLWGDSSRSFCIRRAIRAHVGAL